MYRIPQLGDDLDALRRGAHLFAQQLTEMEISRRFGTESLARVTGTNPLPRCRARSCGRRWPGGAPPHRRGRGAATWAGPDPSLALRVSRLRWLPKCARPDEPVGRLQGGKLATHPVTQERFLNSPACPVRALDELTPGQGSDRPLDG